MNRQGIALVSVLIILVLVVSLVSVAGFLALGNRRAAADSLVAARVEAVAEAGIEQAMYSIFWVPRSRFVQDRGTRALRFDLCAAKRYLTGVRPGLLSLLAAPEKNNNRDCPDPLPNAVISAAVPGLYNKHTVRGHRAYLGDPEEPLSESTSFWSGFEGELEMGARFVIEVTRLDDEFSSGMDFTISSTAVLRSDRGVELARKRLERRVRLAGEPFEGDRFALLTNSTNCSLCHLQIDNMRRVYAAANSSERFDRVRVAALESFDYAPTERHADTVIAGTLYLRNEPKNADRNAPGTGSGHENVLSQVWVDTVGKLGAGSVLARVGLGFSYPDADFRKDAATIDASLAGNAKRAYGKVYTHYPTQDQVRVQKIYSNHWPDGLVPDEFPRVVPDENGNELIDDDEWASYLEGASGGRLDPSSKAVVYGVRRPRSTRLLDDIPISYDPVSANAAFLSSRITSASPLLTQGSPPRAGRQNLIEDLKALWTQREHPETAAYRLAKANLETRYRGFWLQQALASPNNRDFKPVSLERLYKNLGSATSGGETLRWPPTGVNVSAAQNNFWVRFDPRLKRLYLTFCLVETASVAAPKIPDCLPWAARGPTVEKTTDLTGGIDSLSISLEAAEIFPSMSNSARDELIEGLSSGRPGFFDGNLIIDAGTLRKPKPLELHGTLHVNGDLVIRGVMLGEARIVVRGNIYVVGDLVYGCAERGRIEPCTTGDYARATDLPRLALLAGGHVIVGDYDVPDVRANRSQFNLINDVWRYRIPDATTRADDDFWNFYPIVGTSGNAALLNTTSSPLSLSSRTSKSSEVTGFAQRVLADVNRTDRGPLIQHSPFAPIFDDQTDIHEGLDGGSVVARTGNRAIVPVYPSNGPILLGDARARRSGFYRSPASGRSQLDPGLSCTTGANIERQVAKDAPLAVYGLRFAKLHFGFWCPDASNAPQLLIGRNLLLPGLSRNNTHSPAADQKAWMDQPAGNAALDQGAGMSTGWLGGVLGWTVPGAAEGVFEQLGDLSQTRLLKLMWLATTEAERTAPTNPSVGQRLQGPLRTDGLFYAANALISVLRYDQDVFGDPRTGIGGIRAESSTQARWIHNGALFAAELAILATGNTNASTKDTRYTNNSNQNVDFAPAGNGDRDADGRPRVRGPGMGIFYDERLAGLLQIQGGTELELRPLGGFVQGVGR